MFGEGAREGRTVRIKICGLTNEADARLALECGADALGFNFYGGSKRYLDVELAAGWLRRLPREPAKVAILVNPTQDEARRAAALPFIDALQLHGDETPEFCRRLAEEGIRFAKAIPVDANSALPGAPDFSTNTFLLDSRASGKFGGSGETFPWSLGADFVRAHPALKVILAGGLTPENVAAAVAQVHPFGVDVTTGVESSPGRKDPARLRAFFAALEGC